MYHPTYMIAHTTAFVTPVVEHWLAREIALIKRVRRFSLESHSNVSYIKTNVLQLYFFLSLLFIIIIIIIIIIIFFFFYCVEISPNVYK